MEHLYKKKFIILIIIGLIIVACLKSNAAKKNIPAPILNTDQNFELSQGSILTLSGTGFITNYPEAHKVFITDFTKKKPKQTFLEVITANTNNLKILIPENINLGDYDLSLKLASKLLKSKTISPFEKLKIRPKAAPAVQLDYVVISNDQELDSVLANSYEQGLELTKAVNGNLQSGINFLYQIYYRDGFESAKSPYTKFYFLPETEFENELKVSSENPLTSFAVEKNSYLTNPEVDVSDITNTEIFELSKHFFLKSQTNPRYLEHIIKLQAVFIDRVHALEDEFAIFKNRSSKDFPLKGCTLSDSIQVRYRFLDKDSITAHNGLTLTNNLGLNNTGSDLLRLQCPGESNSATILDEFKYEKIDADGFAIRL